MAHEQQPSPTAPELPAERPVHAISEHVPQPRTRAEARELERLRIEHGAAFDAYLARVWNGVEPIPDMEADFTNLHWASYDRIEHFIDDQLDALGWLEPITSMLRTHDLPPELLTWIRTGFAEALHGDFEIIERGGQLHVFAA